MIGERSWIYDGASWREHTGTPARVDPVRHIAALSFGTEGGVRLEGTEDCGGRVCYRLAARSEIRNPGIAPDVHQWSLLVDQQTLLPVRGTHRRQHTEAPTIDTVVFVYEGVVPIEPPAGPPVLSSGR